MNNLFQINVGPITGGEGRILEGGPTSGQIFADVISGTIGVLTIVAAIWFVFQIITGGISIIGAGGDKTKVESGRNKITNGAIGLIVVISATLILGLVTFIFGIDNPLAINDAIQNIGI